MNSSFTPYRGPLACLPWVQFFDSIFIFYISLFFIKFIGTVQVYLMITFTVGILYLYMINPLSFIFLQFPPLLQPPFCSTFIKLCFHFSFFHCFFLPPFPLTSSRSPSFCTSSSYFILSTVVYAQVLICLFSFSYQRNSATFVHLCPIFHCI